MTPSIVELPPRHSRSRGSLVPIDNNPNKTTNVHEQNPQQQDTRPRHNYNTRLNERRKNLPYPTQVISRYLNGRKVTEVIPRFLKYREALRTAESRSPENNEKCQQQSNVEPYRFSRGQTRVFTPSAAVSIVPRL